MFKSRKTLYVLISIFLVLQAFISCTHRERPVIKDGVLDLRSWDFSRNRTLSLEGYWEFVPGVLDISYDSFTRLDSAERMVPDLWSGLDGGMDKGQGFGVYHLSILLPDNAPPIALNYISASTAFYIESDGERVVQVGVPSRNRETAVAQYKPGTVRLPETGNRIELMVGVSNYVYRSGGLWFPILIGSVDAIEGRYFLDVNSAIIQLTSLTLIGLLMLLLYMLRKKDRSFLFCGIFTLGLALRVLVTGQYLITALFPDIPFALMIKIEYFTVASAFFMGTVYFTSLFPDLMSKKVRISCLIPSIVFFIFSMLTPLEIMTRGIIVYYAFVAYNLFVAVIAMVMKLLRKRDSDVTLIFIGFCILAFSALNDIFYNSFMWQTGNLSPWGMGVFVLLQAVVLVRRMTIAFAGVEDLLIQKETLIKEIHHRVKNSLQIVSSLLTLHSNRSASSEVKQVFRIMQNRVGAISLVHEKLYGKLATDSLDLGDYLEDLIGLLVHGKDRNGSKIKLDIQTESVVVPVDICIDAGLIVTELVSNALKYAFLPRSGGLLRLVLEKNKDAICLLLEDDGPGFPEGFLPQEGSSLGFRLINNILRRSRGTLELLAGPGARIKVCFFRVSD